MGIELKPEIKNALLKMDFIRKYEVLSNQYSGENIAIEERLIYYDIDEILETIEKLGYSATLNKRERFFRIHERVTKEVEFGFNIALDDGMVEFIWAVKHKKETRLGTPWSDYSRLLIDADYLIDLPVFRDYDELEDIFKKGFEMYEEFKSILIEEYSK